jgi:hypothetical protein
MKEIRDIRDKLDFKKKMKEIKEMRDKPDFSPEIQVIG